jgi:hypothetical protein
MRAAPERIRAALERVEVLGDEAARIAAREAVSSVLELHRAGLSRLVDRLREAGGSERLLERAAEDELVSSLLLLHDLHPHSLAARVDEALGRLRARGVVAEAISIAPQLVRLLLGRGLAAAEAVRATVFEHAPEVETLELIEEPGTFVPVARLAVRRGQSADTHGRCELCAEALSEQHAHLLGLHDRRLVCACRACSVLLGAAGSADYRLVPSHVTRLAGFRLGDELWRALGVPVGLAFFSRCSATGGVVASYPGPGGPVDATPEPAPWERLVADNPVLAELAPDVEALLVNRVSEPAGYYRSSIDHCYRLAGLVRTRWQGISGGTEIAGVVAGFFASLEEQAR